MTEEHPEVPKAQYHYQKFMEAIGLEDWREDEHLQETPRRVYESRTNELFRGLDEDPRKHLQTAFSDVGQYEGDAGWVIVDSIQIQSICSHHMLPFRGQADIGYIPQEKAVGLSKLARVADGYARRPQVQERLTNQIADAVHEELDPKAVVVVISAEHECMSLRGVQEPHTMTTTSALRGMAREDEHLKEEFFDLVGDTR
jgi:GTP cyclohydrolase I